MIKRHFQSTTKNISAGYKEHFSKLQTIFQPDIKNILAYYNEYFSQLQRIFQPTQEMFQSATKNISVIYKEYFSQLQRIFQSAAKNISGSYTTYFSQKYENDQPDTQFFSQQENQLLTSYNRVIYLIEKNLIVGNCRGRTALLGYNAAICSEKFTLAATTQRRSRNVKTVSRGCGFVTFKNLGDTRSDAGFVVRVL